MGASNDTGTWSGAAGVCGGATGVSGGAVGLLATTPRRVAVSPPKPCIFHPFAQAAFIVPCSSMGMSPGSGFRSNVRPPTCHAHSRHLLTMHQPPTHQSTPRFMFFSPNDSPTAPHPRGLNARVAGLWHAALSYFRPPWGQNHNHITTSPHTPLHRTHQSSGRTEFINCCPAGHCPSRRPLVPVAAPVRPLLWCGRSGTFRFFR